MTQKPYRCPGSTPGAAPTGSASYGQVGPAPMGALLSLVLRVLSVRSPVNGCERSRISWRRQGVQSRVGHSAAVEPRVVEPRPLSILIFVDTLADGGSLRWGHHLSKLWLEAGAAVNYFSLKLGSDRPRPLLPPPVGASVIYGATAVRRFRCRPLRRCGAGCAQRRRQTSS